MSTSATFERFVRVLTPGRAEIEDAVTKRHEVGRKLHSYYYQTVYNGGTSRVIGSYGKNTHVLPVRDLDIMFLLPPSEFARWNSYAGNGQSALLQEVKRILLTRYPRTDIHGDGQVVTVPFQSGHSVEVLPAWDLPDGRFRTPNTHNGGSWHIADHDAEERFVDESDAASNGNTRDLIRMTKAWQDHCNVPIKSLAQELRAVEFLKTWPHAGKGATYHDWMVRDYLAELIERAGYTHVVPGTSDKFEYGDAWVSRAETALRHAKIACDREALNQPHLAAEEWVKVFGSRFRVVS